MAHSFDLVKITKTKAELDISTSKVREYIKQGLKLYKSGKLAFISRSELLDLIKSQSQPQPQPQSKAA